MEEVSTIRREVRAYLANRPSVAQSATTMHRRLSSEFNLTERDVENACTFLLSLDPPQLGATQDPMGNKTYYKITAAGTLAHERGQ